MNGAANPGQPLELNDIITPDPVGLWPIAPGWWILLVILVGALVVAAVLLWQNHRANGYRRAALAELEALPKHNNSEDLQQLAQLLKRAAMAAYPELQHKIAGMHGSSWVGFLNATCKSPVFGEREARLLSQGLYQSRTDFDAEPLAEQVRAWLKCHQRRPSTAQHALAAAQKESSHV